jgi:signal transduction histidine kinase
VYADIAKLERVLGNLVDNAVRHCSDGDSVTIKFKSKDIDQITVTVSDTGRGIEESDLPHIFSPHYKGKNPIPGNKINSGLGLAITRRLLELHNTDIFVDSKIGEGASFWFSLPTRRYE